MINTHEKPVNKFIGHSVARREDVALLKGQGRYVDDVRFPGMNYAAVLRSPYGHARIDKIDASAARSHPEVIGVLTFQDIEGQIGSIRPNWVVGDSKIPDHPVLASDTVRYVGESVAFVVATSRQAAADALELIDVSYTPLDAVVDAERALDTTATQLHANVPGNLIGVFQVGGGDYREAANTADKIVKIRLVNQRLIPSPIEPRAVSASYDSVTEKLTFFLPSQVPHMSRRWLSETLGWPEHKIHLIAPDIGGGFGAKMHFYAEEILVAYASRHFDCPISWTETRSENTMATTHGRAHVEYVEAAVTKDGIVLGLKLNSVANLGAYLSNMATGIPTINTAMFITGNYKIPSMAAEVKLVTTNTTPVDAYRGAGRPEAAYIIERTMDAIAYELGMDPVDLRRKNLVTPDLMPYAPYGHPRMKWDSGDYPALLEKALSEVDYAGWRVKQQQNSGASERLIGIGVCCYMEVAGMGSSPTIQSLGFNRGGWESAQIRVHSDGKVTMFSGSMPQGHGHQTSYAQIVADTLELPLDDVDVVQGDTDRVTAGHGTFNSRSMAVGGSAAFTAAKAILVKSTAIAAVILEIDKASVSYSDGIFKDMNHPERMISFRSVARAAYLGSKLPAGMSAGLDEIVFFEPWGMSAPSGAHAAVVEIDVATGHIEILEYVSVDDAGNLINPMICHGQMHGAIAQGIGQSLFEGAVYDDTGQLLTASLLDYAIPKSNQLPRLRTSFIVTPSPSNPLGVKGIGESGCIGAPPTLVSAVCDALKHLGIRHLDMPLTPPKVWSAIQQAKEAMKEATP